MFIPDISILIYQTTWRRCEELKLSYLLCGQRHASRPYPKPVQSPAVFSFQKHFNGSPRIWVISPPQLSRPEVDMLVFSSQFDSSFLCTMSELLALKLG